MLIQNASLDIKFTMEILLIFKTVFFTGKSNFDLYFRFNTHNCFMLISVLVSLKIDIGPFLEFQIGQLNLEIGHCRYPVST